MKTNKGMTLLSLAWIAALTGVSVWAWQTLPPGAQLPMHWNVAGEVDRFADKGKALIVPPLYAAVSTLLFVAIGLIEPLQDNLAKSRGLLRVVWIGMLGVSGAIELAVIAVGFHWHVAALPLIFGAMGLLFMGLGDQLSKSRPMRFVGIRTPWTLSNQDVWIATHRLGGKLMMIAGLVWLIAALMGWVDTVTLPLLVTMMVAASLIPIPYSYLLWRKRVPRH